MHCLLHEMHGMSVHTKFSEECYRSCRFSLVAARVIEMTIPWLFFLCLLLGLLLLWQSARLRGSEQAKPLFGGFLPRECCLSFDQSLAGCLRSDSIWSSTACLSERTDDLELAHLQDSPEKSWKGSLAPWQGHKMAGRPYEV